MTFTFTTIKLATRFIRRRAGLRALALAGLAAGPLAGTAEASTGTASWYGSGRRTANGETFHPGAMTAAHRSLPFGTHVRVVNERNGRSVVVRINDRGPFAHGRLIDLARAPARAIGLTGTARVALTVLD